MGQRADGPWFQTAPVQPGPEQSVRAAPVGQALPSPEGGPPRPGGGRLLGAQGPLNGLPQPRMTGHKTPEWVHSLFN